MLQGYPGQNRKRESIKGKIQQGLQSQQSLDLLFLGMAALLVLFCGFYAIRFIQSRSLAAGSQTIQFNPGDVVYGPTYHAVHAMGGQAFQSTELPSFPQNGAPQIQISEQYYDFGSVHNQAVLTRTIVIANRGTGLLIIWGAYTTCGCTTADITSTQIPPGKVSLLTVRFDTGYHDIQGSTVRRGIILQTNDADHPTEEIWVQASVK